MSKLRIAVVGAGAFGIALARMLERRLGENAARGVAVLPAASIAVACALGAATSTLHALSTLGLAAAALVSIVSAIALLAKAVEASRL
jgi:NADH dehydrogenase FAD-containing subunit